MVFPMVQALDNPLVLMEVLKTPEGRKAAAVMLTQAGVTPEKFITKVAQTPSTPGADQQAVTAPTGSDLAKEVGQESIRQVTGGPNMLDIGTLLAGGGGDLTYGGPTAGPATPQGTNPAVYNVGAGGAGTQGSVIDPRLLQTALSGVKGIQGPQASIPTAPGVAPGQGSVGGLNPLSIQQLIQLALGGRQAAAPPPSLGQLFAQGGLQ